MCSPSLSLSLSLSIKARAKLITHTPRDAQCSSRKADAAKRTKAAFFLLSYKYLATRGDSFFMRLLFLNSSLNCKLRRSLRLLAYINGCECVCQCVCAMAWPMPMHITKHFCIFTWISTILTIYCENFMHFMCSTVCECVCVCVRLCVYALLCCA